MIVTLLVIIFSPFLIAIPLQRNTEIFHGNEILPDKYSLDTENTGLRNGVVPSSEAHSRNSRETEVSPSQYELLSGISAINKTIPNSSKKQLSKAAVTPDKLARSKKTGNKGAKRGGDPDPNINADPFSPTLENGLSESEAGSLSSGLALSTISDPFASSNVSIYTTSFPNVGSSLSTHNSRKPPDAHGSGDGLFASEGALYRALYVVFALVLLVLLYFFIKFAIMRYRAMRANRRPTYGYGKLNGRRGGGGSSETQRLGAPDDEDDEDEDAGEEDEVDRYIASIRQGQTDEMADHVVFQQRPPNAARSAGLTTRVEGPGPNGSAPRLGFGASHTSGGLSNGSTSNNGAGFSVPSGSAASAPQTRLAAGGPSPLS